MEQKLILSTNFLNEGCSDVGNSGSLAEKENQNGKPNNHHEQIPESHSFTASGKSTNYRIPHSISTPGRGGHGWLTGLWLDEIRAQIAEWRLKLGVRALEFAQQKGKGREEKGRAGGHTAYLVWRVPVAGKGPDGGDAWVPVAGKGPDEDMGCWVSGEVNGRWIALVDSCCARRTRGDWAVNERDGRRRKRRKALLLLLLRRSSSKPTNKKWN